MSDGIIRRCNFYDFKNDTLGDLNLIALDEIKRGGAAKTSFFIGQATDLEDFMDTPHASSIASAVTTIKSNIAKLNYIYVDKDMRQYGLDDDLMAACANQCKQFFLAEFNGASVNNPKLNRTKFTPNKNGTKAVCEILSSYHL